ncbi:MAG: protein translocase subunit SecF [Desulfobacteraceae bacterium]|nr:protein translocase subunit SecF [Desulfobacteraceae bacterium]
MFQFIKSDINLDFIGKRKIAYVVSLVLILSSVAFLVINKGPRYGVDFSGGTVIHTKFDAPVNISDITKGLGTMNVVVGSVQTFGNEKDNEFLIRAEHFLNTDKEFSTKVEAALKQSTGKNVEIRGIEIVGPQVGQELREKALFAIFYAMLFIAIYISGRFEFKWLMSALIAGIMIGAVYLFSLLNIGMLGLTGIALLIALGLFWVLKLKYAMGAIVALIHDVAITLGVFSILGKEVSLITIAALLTIIGYSLNDTIIVYDRIRENVRKNYKMSLGEIINRSINETLSRTILTSGTTLIVVLSLLLLGGATIHDFAFAMLVGIVVGTYSSIYVASPILLEWQDK